MNNSTRDNKYRHKIHIHTFRSKIFVFAGAFYAIILTYEA